MNPLLRSPRNLLLAALVWSPLAVGLAGLGVRVGQLTWGRALLLMMPPMVVCLFLAASTWYLCRSEPLRLRRFGRLLLVHGAGCFFFSLLFYFLIFLCSRLLDAVAGSGWNAAVNRMSIILFLTGLLLYLLAMLFHYLVLAVEEAGIREREAVEERLAASRAELRALKATAHPHFLFNSLAALAALIGSDPERARSVCLDLADFLRYTLRLGREDWVQADDEIKHAGSYLNIEKARLGERLVFYWNLESGVETFPLPVLTLLPLIENAVKHGIGTRLAGGRIDISLRRLNSGLRIEVTNPEPPPDAPQPPGEGIGLKTLASRLALHYGREIRPRLTRNAGRVTVALDVPATKEKAR